MKTREPYLLCTFMATIASFSGCAAPDPESAAATTLQTQEAVGGRLLERVSDAEGRTFELYEVGSGTLAVEETTPLGLAPLSEQIPRDQWSFAELYRRLRPGAAVPQAILDADARNASAMAEPPPAGLVSAEDAQSVDLEGDDAAGETRVLADCGDDALNDNFGADWFMKKYCTGGKERWCQTNRGSGYIKRKAAWFRWTVMAADHSFGAHIRIKHEEEVCRGLRNPPPPEPGTPGLPPSQSCGPEMLLVFDKDIGARGIKTFTVTGKNFYSTEAWAQGDAACQRVHYAACYDPP